MTDAVRQALEWYAAEAEALAKNTATGAHTQAVLASVTVLALDGGRKARAALSEQPAIDMDELRRAVCLIGTVGTIDGHDVIRRNSALEIIDARIDRAST